MQRLLFTAVFISGFIYTYAQVTIKGIVRDVQTGQPIPGATISVQDRMAGADNNGRFELSVPDPYAVLHVSSIGYINSDVPLRGKENILILLEPANYALNQIQVNTWSNTSRNNQLKEAQSVGVLTIRDFQRTNNIFPENTLNMIPGVLMQSRTISGGQRIIIRGYGNNTNFNNQGVKVYLNNIPITDASGTTIFDDIDFTTVGKAEVFKGPASSIYGAGIAGVVNLYSIKPEPNQTRLAEDNTWGSNGLWRNNTRIEAAGSNAAIIFNYGHQKYDGFRPHSADKKDFANFNGDFYLGDRQTISTYFSYNNSYEELAGEIDSAQLYGRQKYSDPAYVNNNAHVQIESFRAGVTDNYRISNHFSNQSTLFASGYTLDQPFAAGYNSNAVMNFGGRTGFVYESNSAGISRVHGILGAQFQKTVAFTKSYNLSNGVQGGMRGDLQSYASQANAFTEWKFTFPGQLIITAGGSLNFLDYTISDLLANSANPAHKDQSGYKQFTPVFTPRVSILKSWNDRVSVYADVSTGYTPPSTASAVIPAIGKVNEDLKPEQGIQYEVGSKGSLFHKKLSYQLALFDLNVQDKIVNVFVPANGSTPAYSYASNIGEQQNLGAELSLSYTIINDPSAAVSLLRPFVTYTYSDFQYRKFNNGNQATNYSDNKVAGVAPHMANAGLDVETKPGFYLYSTWQYVDPMPYTFDNMHFTKAFNLLGGKIGFRKNIGHRFDLDVFVGGENLLNQTWFSFLFLSPTISAQTDPHFIPASYTATMYRGLKLAYRF